MVERTRLVNQLHAQMLQLDPEYKAKSGPLAAARGMHCCREVTLPGASPLVQTRLLVVHQLADQLLRLHEDIAAVQRSCSGRVRATGTPLLDLRGVGEVTAARLIGEVGVTPRLGSAAALAAFSGTAPIALSSGGRAATGSIGAGTGGSTAPFTSSPSASGALNPGRSVLREETGRGQD